MNLNIVCRHFDHTESIENRIKDKAAHLAKFFDGKIDVDWTCSLEKNFHKSDVKVHAGHNVFHASAQDNDLYKTFDEVVPKLEKQLRKKNTMMKDHIHHQA
jgi:putative sigma-54 modulation protein